ncbi:MAG TPA: hypothetical protein VK348_01465 [Planctomycetota bacterium]|nr:hypothetical protein [Planctomycetota bacterium]
MLASYREGPEHGYVHVDPGDHTLKWVVVRDGGPAAARITLPVDFAGAATYLGEHVFVVSGLHLDHATPRNILGGVLMLIRLDPATNQIALVQQQSYPGIDPYQLCHNAAESILYLFDYQGERVLFLPLDKSKPILVPGESALPVVAVTKAQVPLLERWRSRTLAPRDGSGFMIGSTRPLVDTISRYEVFFSGTGWAVLPVARQDIGAHWDIRDPWLNAHGTFSTTGATGPFELWLVGDATPTLTGMATSDPFLVHAPALGLIPGGSYYLATRDGVPGSTIHVCNGIWGAPLPGPRIALQHDTVDDLRIANDRFVVTARILWLDATNEATSAFQTCLWAGIRDPSRPAVIEDGQGHAVLANVQHASRRTPTTLDGRNGGHMIVGLPVPDDPTLEGVELLFQWAAFDGDEVLVSEVHSSLIFPKAATFASQDHQPATTPATAGDHRPHARVGGAAAADRWLSGRPGDAQSLGLWNETARRFRGR